MRLEGRGRFNPSFYRLSLCPAFRAFACLPYQRHRQTQSLLFLVARSFFNTFHRLPVLRQTGTAKVNLYQGVPPSLPVFRFDQGTCSHAPICLLVRLVRAGKRADIWAPMSCPGQANRSVIGFQLALPNGFSACVLGSNPL